MSELAPLRLGAVTVDPPLFLAPMAGVTDRDFRLIVRRIGGVGLVAMEFLPSKGLVRGEKRVRELTHFCAEERPIAIQIYGSDAATMAEAARRVEEMGADVCDVNMGCPANKVLKGCAGAALMGDLRLAEDVVRRVRRAIRIPLTVKFRLGLDEGRRSFLELGRVCEANGVDAVALHARTARQMFGGAPSWPAIAELKAALAIPVIGNGDVRSADDALALVRATGCDGVMIGRGATRDPWVFHRIAARLARQGLAPPSLDERRELILGHFRAVIERESAPRALHKLRTFTGWYSHGLPGGQRLRRQIRQLPDPPSFVAAVERFFDDLLLARPPRGGSGGDSQAA
jgi:nifR3 family TIM-barrel protein